MAGLRTDTLIKKLKSSFTLKIIYLLTYLLIDLLLPSAKHHYQNTEVYSVKSVDKISVANLVADNATDFSEVGAGVFRLDVLTALGSEDDVAAYLSDFVGRLVFCLHAKNDQ